MAGQAYGAVGKNLHSGIAAERLEITEIELETGVGRRDDSLQLPAIRITAIRRETHDLAFIAIFGVADELADHGVCATERVREEHTIQNFNLAAFAASGHGG